ncbi:expressed unknown protein [Seminavis robusta]|uniref:Uncharacterized protein n=1 Tax=Seminavis robusta TaxID=568900 RepID=A0A9N8DTZ5_9STRA|nr:expressed unknown protein [Seminavis robusta]|eukprot:Sro350_g123641.1  (136) ;mRNA; r:7613-8020
MLLVEDALGFVPISKSTGCSEAMIPQSLESLTGGTLSQLAARACMCTIASKHSRQHVLIVSLHSSYRETKHSCSSAGSQTLAWTQLISSAVTVAPDFVSLLVLAFSVEQSFTKAHFTGMVMSDWYPKYNQCKMTL